MAQLAQCLCGFFTLIQPSGLAGSSLHLGTKKGPVTKTGPEVCSQFGKLTKLLLGAYKCRILI